VTRTESSEIVVEKLSVEFSGRAVLKDISFSTRSGEITVILGPSGSGKSTLLRAINRLNEVFPDCRTQGADYIRLGGIRLDIYRDSIPLPDLRRRLGMLFQLPTVLPFSIEKNLSMPLRVVMGMKGADLRKRMEWALKQVVLWEEVKSRLQDPGSTLSGGQKQRLCLARVLCLEPDALLLDEPPASLDFKAAASIETLLLELKKMYPILAVTHSLSQAQRIADRVLVLREGRIVQTLTRNQMEDPTMLQELLAVAF